MFDYKEERDNLVPAGTYEATATCGGVSLNNYGEEIIRLSWKIRDDVPQACQGRIVFDDIRKEKNNPEEFNQQKIYEIIHGGQDKANKSARFQFETYDDICLYINGMNVRIDVDVKTSNSGKKFNCIKYGGYHPTMATGQTIPDGGLAGNGVEDLVSADDPLPF